MKTRFFVMSIAFAVGLCSVIPQAFAEDKKTSATKKDDRYGYIFTDDILNAGGIGANSDTVKVRRVGQRELLLRPRVHFVPEMLKSVEKM